MNNRIFKLLRNWLVHFVLLWIVIFLSEVLNFIYYRSLNYKQQFRPFNGHLPDLLAMAIFLLLTELNYRYVFKKFKWPVFTLGCLLLSLISFILLMLLYPERLTGVLADIQPVLFMTGYAFIYAPARDYFYNLYHKKDIELQQSKNELDVLKAQLNPHFLFNSLNYLYGTALNERAPNTADGIDKLSEMMRYTITGVHESYVSIENELKFIEHYLALQQARLPKNDNIKITVQIQCVSKLPQIAPLLLLPFIENAFKYGISMDEPCFVKVVIAIADNNLIMKVNNSMINTRIERKGNNTGIKNTIKRLELLYPDNYKLQQKDIGTEYQTLLTLKLKP